MHRDSTQRDEPAKSDQPQYNGECILVVEDNVINQQVAQARLRKLGCEVVLAANGIEALKCIEHQSFELVLMDCQMPEMDGYECTDWIRSHREKRIRTLPVVAMTANVMPEDREKCRKHRMSDFLGKPVTTEQLCEVLDRWVGRLHTDDIGAAQASDEQMDSSQSLKSQDVPSLEF